MLSMLACISFSPINIFGADNTACDHVEKQPLSYTLENGTKVAFEENNHTEAECTKERKKSVARNIKCKNTMHEYYIAPEPESSINNTLPYSKSRIVKLEESNCYKVGNRELISLGVLKSHLGMEITLNEDRTIDIFSKGERIVTIYIDENKYANREKITTLSTQPILVNGLDLSVPFDFFDKLLYTTIIRDRCGIMTIIHDNN